jgi:hypothetical protein
MKKPEVEKKSLDTVPLKFFVQLLREPDRDSAVSPVGNSTAAYAGKSSFTFLKLRYVMPITQ